MHISNFVKLFSLIPPLAILFILCTVSEEVKEGDVEVHISTSAGSSFEFRDGDKSITFLPYIINEGDASVNGKNSIMGIVGKRIDADKHIYARPIAKLNYKREQKEQEIIIAIPAEKKYRSMEITSYDDLLTEYFATKQLIEYWYANRYGLGGVSDIRWNAF